MSVLDTMRGLPTLPDRSVPPPRPAMPPLSKRPAPALVSANDAAPLVQPVPPPACQAWGDPRGINGLVHRDASGLCLTFAAGPPGSRVAFAAPMTPDAALELVMGLATQLQAWKRDFGQGGAS